MRNTIIQDCPVTKSDVTPIRCWSINPHNIYTGVDLVAKEVYSVCCGVVIHVGKDVNNTYSVTVQYDVIQCVRYNNLYGCCVSSGDIIEEGQLIGNVVKFVNFEYIKSIKPDPAFPVRVGKVTYYKYDPMDILTKKIKLIRTGITDVEDATKYTEFPVVDMCSEMDSEFLDGRGDDG